LELQQPRPYHKLVEEYLLKREIYSIFNLNLCPYIVFYARGAYCTLDDKLVQAHEPTTLFDGRVVA